MNVFRIICVCLVMALAAACGEKRPDTIYIGGTIYTGNPDQPVVQAVGTRDAWIISAGDANEVIKHSKTNTRVVDLTGMVMYPGFIRTYTVYEVQENQSVADNIEALVKPFSGLGYTTLHLFGVRPDDVRVMEDLAMQGRLPLRVYNVIDQSGFERLAAYGPGVSPGGLVETRSVLIDVEQPFTPFTETEAVPTLDEVLKLALDRDVQLVFKQPKQEVEAVLDAIEDSLEDAMPDADPRWRWLVDGDIPQDISDRIRRLGLQMQIIRPAEQAVMDAFQGAESDRKHGLSNLTIESANLGFREKMTGSIEVGKMADFSVFSGDFLLGTDAEAEGITPQMTIVGGAQTWPAVSKPDEISLFD